MPTNHKGTLREVLALNTFIKLTRATDSVMSRLVRRGTMESLTPSQFGVLETLYHLGPLCQGEISAKLLRSGGNTTLVIDNLEKLRLVRRDRDPDDRRLVRVSLTNAGTALISRIFPEQARVITEEMSTLTAEEQQQLGALCKKLGKGACQHEHEGPDGGE